MSALFKDLIADRVCVVSGTGSGVGQATASLFAERGALVAAIDIRNDFADCAASGMRMTRYRADISKSNQVEQIVDAILAKHGRIDILVNNAGIGLRGSALDTTETEWDEVMAVNAKGTFLLSKAVLPSMIGRKGGVIVNVASVAALVGIKERAAYCASKGAVAALTRALAVDHAHHNIRVNAVAPGTIDTPFFGFMEKTEPPDSDWKAALAARQLMGRLGTPQEIAQAIFFLATDQSSFLTGTILTADGGMTAW